LARPPLGPGGGAQDLIIQRYKRVEPGVAERDIPVENDPTSAVGIPGPLQEVTCSETTVSYYGDMLPIPQADRPDF